MDTQKMFALGEVKSVEDANGDPNGEFDVVLSAPTLDRDGEVIDAKIFEPLPDHITFDIDHGMSTATTVGSGTPFYDGDVLRVKGTYSSIPRAQEVRTLVREGHIRTTSVAFMGAVREEKDGVPHIVKAELLNGAFVPIPSNRESVVLSAKTYAEKAGVPTLKPTNVLTRKTAGMTANDLREALARVTREAYGDDTTDIWVRDYADEWVVFEAYGADTYSIWQQAYTVTDGAVSLDGQPVEVSMHTTYEPITAPPDSATPAPVTPASEAGKSPASTVVAKVRLDLERVLDGLPA